MLREREGGGSATRESNREIAVPKTLEPLESGLCLTEASASLQGRKQHTIVSTTLAF